MATATAAAIRDRAIAVIKSLDPTVVSGDRFIPHRNEWGANFRDWALKNPASCVRRYQVRTTGADRPIEVTDEQLETHYLELEVVVAYPQTHRWGADAALDRDDVMEADRFLIDDVIGVRGSANFSYPYPDATWRGQLDVDVAYERADGVDFLVIKQLMSYLRDVSGTGSQLAAPLAMMLGG